MRIKILSGAFAVQVAEMFQRRGHQIVYDDFEAIVFTGGADICPALYGQKNVSSYFSEKRDEYEIQQFRKSPKNFPKIGICRGAQLLNVLSGGKMHQDTDNHERSHVAIDVQSGSKLKISSIHHQMMNPSPDARVLTVAKESTYISGDGYEIKRKLSDYDDIETVYYPETNSLCYQGHPEIDRGEGQEYFFKLLKDHMVI